MANGKSHLEQKYLSSRADRKIQRLAGLRKCEWIHLIDVRTRPATEQKR